MKLKVHLTKEEKAYNLKTWQETIEAGEAKNWTGPGVADERVITIVEEINDWDDMCTTQSCCGHAKDNVQQKEPGPAVLWIRTTARVDTSFKNHIGLLNFTDIYPSILFNREGVGIPVWEFKFPGMDVSEEIFEANSLALLSWINHCMNNLPAERRR